MIRMLAFDLDGTTITQHKNLSAENKAALIKAHEKGVVLVPATGRMKEFLPEVVLALPGVRYVITSNGGAVYDLLENRVIHQRLIPNEKARRVQKILNEYDVYVEYYRNGSAITKRGYPERAEHFGLPEIKILFIKSNGYELVDDFDEMLAVSGLCPEKINLPYLSSEIYDELWQKLDSLGGLRLTTSIRDNIEINSIEAHKGEAVLALAEQLGFAADEVMAVGDNGNDVTMLQAAGYSVAVGDGAPSALAAAKYITAPHDENGLAAAIEKFIL